LSREGVAVPSGRKQLNIRLDPATEARLPRVREAASAALGIPLSVADVFRLALIELEKKYPPLGSPEPQKRGSRR
jgi:hypothetical protein